MNGKVPAAAGIRTFECCEAYWFKPMKRILLITMLILLWTAGAFATHQRAGEITYRHLFGLTYEVTILTYTFAPSPADRPELLIEWGDGANDILPRIEAINLPNDIRRNVYKGQHTYSAPAVYVISLEDPNRNYGIINIPNSVNVPLYIQTVLVINPFLGANSSPVLSLPPIDNGCVGIPYIHNPGAFDPDDDSLSYRLIDCKGAGGLDIPGYTLPPASTSFTLDPVTGDLYWDAPTMQGEFNVAILIEEWRNGVFIGSVTRDMQIIIAACNQQPPVIAPLKDTCVEAGDYLAFTVSATDTITQIIHLTGSGAPLQLSVSSAHFDSIYGQGEVYQTFTWQTECAHVKRLPYTLFFKAQDNGKPVSLVDIETMLVTVVGPAPENLSATPLGSGINLDWDISPCPNADGYEIFRRVDSSGWMHGYCETGVPAYTGFQRIAVLDRIDSTSFRDDNDGKGLTHGLDYCYVVVATYPDGALSYASNEACATLKRDVPILINNSIRSTDATNGSVFVRWVRPTELDSVQTPGPFSYRVLRATASGSFIAVAEFPGLDDTTFIDTPLNTETGDVTYDIELVNLTPGDTFTIGKSGQASSVFLGLTSTDRSLLLNWTAGVPWINEYYVIHRLNDQTGDFEPLDTVPPGGYLDTGLVNGITYCYRVEAIGRYSRPDLPSPLLNWSQEVCGTPIDNVPPCPPLLEVMTDCEIPANVLEWNAFLFGCPDDVARYEIFYAARPEDDPELIASIPDGNTMTYSHSGSGSITGCYYVVAIDSLDNRSDFSEAVCVDYDVCDLYRLPNVFTPNGDGFNDEFIPFPYASVLRVDMTIFNRWGGVVYKTDDPDIRWDGRHKDSGQLCSDGVYYYVCEVYEIRLEGLVPRTIRGVVTLLR
jgi:gliding motility-associated-like protein